MAHRSAGRDGRDHRRGVRSRFAFALTAFAFANLALADEIDDARALVDAILGTRDALTPEQRTSFVKAVLALQAHEGARRPPPERLIELLAHAEEVARAIEGKPDVEAAVVSLRVRELTNLGRADEALAAVEGRVDALIDAAPRCGAQLALEAYEANIDAGRYEEAARLLAVADAKSSDATGYALRDIAFIVAEKRLLAAQDQGTPDRTAHWQRVLERRLAALGTAATPARRNSVLRHAIVVALASGSKPAAFDACDAADAVPRDEADPRLSAFVRLRRAIASRLDGHDPRELSSAAVRSELEWACSAADLGAEDRALAGAKLATIALRAGEYDAAERAIQDFADAAATEPVKLTLAALSTELALAKRAPMDALAECTDALHGRLVARFDAFARAPLTADGVGPLYYAATRDALAVWITAHRLLGRSDADAVATIVRGQASGTLARRLGARAPTLADLRSHVLADGEGLLLYVFAPRGNHVFAIDRDGIAHAEGGDSRDVLAARDDLVEEITTRPDLGQDGRVALDALLRARERGQRLGRLLVPESVEARVRAWSGIAFCGIEVFGTMPCEAAIVGDEVLGTSKAVRVLPSIPVAAYLAAVPRVAPVAARAVVVAARAPAAALRAHDARLADLPVGTDRLRAWLEPFAPESIFLVDAAATPRAFRDLDARAAALMVVLAHGYARLDAERAGALALTPTDDGDGLLTCDDVESTRGAQTVFLATCAAGRGPRRAGDDGAQHLGGAFLSAGTSTVVLALGPTDLDATLALVDAFVPAFAAGVSVASAMQDARARVAQDTRFAHPYSFAQFQVFGH